LYTSYPSAGAHIYLELIKLINSRDLKNSMNKKPRNEKKLGNGRIQRRKV
jgi:hypothetical protein